MDIKKFTEQSPLAEVIASYEELAAAYKVSEDKVGELQLEAGEATKTIDDLTAKLEAATAQKSTASVVVTHDKKDYHVITPKFNFEGKDYVAEDLKTNTKLLAELVKIGFGGLVEVRERKKS